MKILDIFITFLLATFLLSCTEFPSTKSIEETPLEVKQAYHQNGNIAAETYFRNGLRDSTHKEWFPNGNLQLVRQYNKGEIVAEKLLTLEGEVIKNIVIKDGRKYGLLFSSFCVNGVAKSPKGDSLIFKSKVK